MTADQSLIAPPALDAELDIRWEAPVVFHSLGVQLPEDQRQAHIAEIAAEVWSGGTEFQRTTVAGWYRDIAAEAAEDGAVYTGFALLGTGDDRVSVATLVILAEESDTSDPEIAAAALLERLSADPANEVFRSDVSCGPAVVSISGMVMDLTEQAGEPTSLELAQAEVYIPVPQTDTLLVCRISTPSIADFPDYVTMLAQMADTVVYDKPGTTPETAAAATLPGQSRITEAFG
ncbi:hypothetical protein [Saccharothrix sp. ST-888]|uniref:hypothetical protein n=1 Tax=Saccharothrix sp. ST-888 TaxID=1427391 RepID=UPI0006969579|nr:hypothetical protein [Saccharothrix sp. ST-888]